jgi:type IV secretory pathway VirB10-like protein
MPIPIVPILLFIAIAIISSAAKAKEQQRRQQQAAQRQKQQAFPPVHSAPAPASPAPRPVPQETEAQRRARQEELKRRLEENRQRREQELKREADARRMEDARRIEEQRSRLEKRPMVTTIQTARTEKPVIAHEDDDCGGGSIHDGYHEGVTQFPNGRPPAVAGRLGNRLADEDERIERERVSAENARRVMKRISKLPPLAQGMIYSEILGKPKSEIA